MQENFLNMDSSSKTIDIKAAVSKICCDLHKNIKLSEKEVENIISVMKNFILDVYNPFLYEKVFCAISYTLDSDKKKSKLKKTFEEYKDPLKEFSSAIKRYSVFQKDGLLVDAEINVLEEIEDTSCRREDLKISERFIHSYHLPPAHSLKALLSIDGLLDATLSYMNHLSNEKGTYFNFVNGSLWKKKKQNFAKTDGIPLPLFIFFDDVETGNALVSHATKNHVGGVYATLGCFPPSFAAKLESIVITDIFFSKDRKIYGNKAVLKKLLPELRSLRDNGIEILNKKKIKIYFLTCLVLGDNLGLNGILELVESFYNTNFCRIFYVGTEYKQMVEEDISILRTKESYKLDIQKINTQATGIKEECVFNKLNEDYHAIENGNCDMMHDLFEGLCNYVMTGVILKLIEEKHFNFSDVNKNMRMIDFDFEKSNIPLDIDLDYVQKHGHLKMSSAEMLFFTRYFGLIIGHMVERNNDVFSLYGLLREMVSIMTSPDPNDFELDTLGSLIKSITRNILTYLEILNRNSI